MRAKKILLMSFLLGVLFPWYLYPQFVDQIHQEMVRTSEKKPIETISGPEKVNVNTSGKFSLEIPLLNVPQRNGKSFPIKLSYSPGIKVMDPSTWVGAGFNMDIGSIRRIPIIGSDYDVKKKIIYENWYMELEQMPYTDYYTNRDQRDYYMISCPGGSGKILQFQNGTTNEYRFELEEYKVWTIEYDNDKDRFLVHTEDGTIYVFGMYLVGLSSNTAKEYIDTQSGLFWYALVRPFMEWKLTAILGADYKCGGADFYDPLSAPNPAIDNKGDWIAIDYRYDENADPKKWNYHSKYQGNGLILDYSLNEITYPYRLITPTHVAEFVTENEIYNKPNDFNFLQWNRSSLATPDYVESWPIWSYLSIDVPQNRRGYLNKRLKEINLYQYSGTGSTHESQSLKKVGFSYYDASTDPVEYQSRTFLKEVSIKGGDGSNIPPYKFDYFVDQTAIPVHPTYTATINPRTQWCQGDYGWYNSDPNRDLTPKKARATDGRAWNLKSITYPTGGKNTFDYEYNQFVWPYASAININDNDAIGHGPRLLCQQVQDGIGNNKTYTYTYSNFLKNSGTEVNGKSIYALTPNHYYAYNVLTDYYHSIYSNQIGTDVQYRKIVETCSNDASRTVYWYKVRDYDDLSVRNQELGNDPGLIKAATIDLNGALYKVEYFNENNNLTKSIINNYSTSIQSTLYSNAVPPYWFSTKPVSNIKTETYYGQDGASTPVTSTEYTYFNAHALVSRVEKVINENERKFEKIMYSGDLYGNMLSSSIEAVDLANMQMKGINSAVLEKIRGKYNPTTGIETVESAELTLYKSSMFSFTVFPSFLASGQFYPSKTLLMDASAPVSDFSQLTTTGEGWDFRLSYDSRYKLKQSYAFNDYGEITETIDANNVKTTYQWDKAFRYKTAVIRNNTANNIASYDDFEDGTYGSWSCWTNGSSGTAAHSGTKGWHFNSTDQGHITKCISAAELNTTGKYILSGWIKSSTANPGCLQWYVSYNNGASSSYPAVVYGTGTGEWEYLELAIDLSAYTNIQNIDLYARNHNGTSYTTCDFDDLRFMPADALMTTQTCDSTTHLVTSQSDENSIQKFYEYDSFNRLVRIKDHKGRVMTETNYYYSAENSTGTFTSSKPNMILQSNFVNGNLLKNWSFEENGIGANTPTGWVGDGSITDDYSYSGGKSLYLTSGFTQYQDLGVFKAGHTYTASAWFIAGAGTSGSISLGNFFGNNANDNIVTQTISGNNDGNWRQISVTLTMNADRQVQVYLGTTEGEFMHSLYDNVVVEEVNQVSQPLFTTSYLDGLMKTVQTQTALGNDDITQHLVYDANGQLMKKYKPYQFTSLHKYDQSFDTHTTDYYNGTVYEDMSDNNPFQLYSYLADGRVKNQKPEGTAWQNDATHHFMRYDYLTDAGSGNHVNLAKTVITDENNNTTETYTDPLDNVIKSVRHNGTEELVTSFEHDTRGNIVSVTSPKGFVSTYTYNTLGKVSQKTTPDEGTAQYLYDKVGNLRFIKDANQTANVNNVSIVQSIDQDNSTTTGSFQLFGRGKVNVCINPSIELEFGFITVQIKTTDGVNLYTLQIDVEQEIYGTGSIILPAGTYNYTVTGEQVYPSATEGFSIQCVSNYDFVYNTYDNFGRIKETGEFENAGSGYFTQNYAESQTTVGYSSQYLPSIKNYYDTKTTYAGAAGQRNLKGRLSWQETYRLGGLVTREYYSYDELGRVEWVVIYGLGWYDKKITYKYNLLGNLIKKDFVALYGVQMHNALDYDAAGRLTTVKTSSDPNMVTGVVQEAAYNYFASGKQKRLQLGNAQGVDYRYNERDWLTMINHQNLNSTQDPGLDGSANGVPYTDRFGMVIGYNVPGNIGDPSFQNATPQWNGNVSWLMYNMYGVNFSGTGSTSLLGNTYTYDPINRLTNSNFGYYYNTWLATNAFDASYTYDKNGNFTTNTWKDNLGSSSSLNYSYYSGQNNKLSLTSGTGGYLSYGYDNNGNVVKDQSKNISLIIYDINNLPVTVYTSTQKIIYSYDAAGNRVRKLIVNNSTGATVSDISYVNGVDGKTEAIAWSYNGTNYTYNIWSNDMIGQIRMNGATVNRFYYLKDHLGTIRMTVDAAANVVSYDDYYPYGMVMPTRSSVSSSEDSRYKFTSKERDAETTYDYFGARYYDSRIGRWLSVDPMATARPGLSPYNYCQNNPLILIDPDGALDDWVQDANGAIYWDENATSQANTKKGETYLGKTVVEFNGSIEETLGDDSKMGGGEDVLATVTVYGSGGSDDITTYEGYTMSSDPSKFGVVADGVYTLDRLNSNAKKGPYGSEWTLNNRGKVAAKDGINPAHPERDPGYLDGVFVHRPNKNGWAGTFQRDGKTHGVSEGCLLINPNQWDRFNKQLNGIDKLPLILKR